METPFSPFFVRNNGDLPSPIRRPPTRRLEITGAVERPASFTLRELKARFETVTVAAVIECAGNGRAFLDPPVSGRSGIMGRWPARAGPASAWRTCSPMSACAATRSIPATIRPTGRSANRTARRCPAACQSPRHWHPETLLAFAMSGEPLHALHGGPLRVVAPGYPGSAWQKWLDRLDIRDREHDGEKMGGTDYRSPSSPCGRATPSTPRNSR